MSKKKGDGIQGDTKKESRPVGLDAEGWAKVEYIGKRLQIMKPNGDINRSKVMKEAVDTLFSIVKDH